MTLLQFLKLYGVGAVVCFGLDVLWLGVLARTFYQNQLGYLMRPDVRWVPALLFYLIYVAALIVIVVIPAVEKQSFARAVLMGASRTWRIPVRGRFSFTPVERAKPARGGFAPRGPLPKGDEMGQQILHKGCCYTCGRSDGGHAVGCPRRT